MIFLLLIILAIVIFLAKNSLGSKTAVVGQLGGSGGYDSAYYLNSADFCHKYPYHRLCPNHFVAHQY